MASANLRYRKNGGAVQSTSQEVASGDVITLLATSYAGWATPAARWEIVAYPPGWSAPAGWSTDADNGRYYYLANSGVSGVTPPTVTIPDPATTWGKWTFRLTVNGSVVSSDLSVETVSPSLGLHDLALAEGSQFGGTRQWVGQHQENLRTLDAGAGGANAGAAYVTDSATVVNASDRPLRGLTGTLPFKGTNVAPASFERASAQASTSVAVGEWNRSVSDASGHGATGTAGYWSMYIPDGAGTKSEAARFTWSWSAILGPYADFVLSVATNPGGGGLGPVVTFSGGGAIRLHGSAYAHDGYRLVVDASGNVSASAISSSEVTTALGYTPATNARTLTGTSPITIAGDNVAHDLSADRTIAFSVGADVPWGGHGITGIASLDNSGGSLTLGANTTGQTIGKSGTTAALAGAATVTGTLGVSDVVTINKDNITTTQTFGITVANATNSGTQYTGQIGFSAYNGGTVIRSGLRLEPQSTSRGKVVLYYGTGASPPASTGTYFDSSDPNFGSCVVADAIVCRSGSTTGFRFDQSSNRGGLDQDGSNNLRLKSYSGKGVFFAVYSDAGSTLVSTPVSFNGSGQGFVQCIPTTPTSSANALTIDLRTSQNSYHALTENTTVTIIPNGNGQKGTIIFSQGGTAYTVTMPNEGSGNVEYDATTFGLGYTAMVQVATYTRTLFDYQILPNGRTYIYGRSVSHTIP